MLASGCICCTIRSDLEETLRTLLVQRDRGEVPPFRRILVETTGLADPAPIVQLLLNNPLVSHFLRLDTVVTTVDAANAIHQLDHQYEAVKQVALADRLLITKCDLVSNIAALEQRLRAAQPRREDRTACCMARSIRRGCSVPPCSIPRKKRSTLRAGSTSRRSQDPASRRTSTTITHHSHAHHGHDAGITSFVLAFDEPLDWMAVSQLARVSARRARRGPAAGQRHSQSPRRSDAGRDPRRPPCLPSAGGAPQNGPTPTAARASCSLPAASRAKRCSRYGRQAARQLKTVAAIHCGILPMSVKAAVRFCR